jgi:hypothetical protein
MPSGKNAAILSHFVLVTVILFSIAMSGCGDKGAEEARLTPAPTPSPAQASTPAESSEPTLADELHGKGTCDMCHDAPTLEKMRSGDHKLAFERDPDLHKSLCRKCHQVSSFCGTCHPVPEIVES